MRVIFTKHAKDRLRQRDIGVHVIRQAFKKPTLRKPSYPPTEILQYFDKERTLEVVFKQQHETIIVITAYYL